MLDAVQILTEKELAASLGISHWTVRTWRIKAGLPYFGTSGRIFYRKDAVIDWIKSEEMRNAAQSQNQQMEMKPCLQK